MSTIIKDFPEIGSAVTCKAIKVTFTQAILQVIRVENIVTEIGYKVILKGNSLGEDIFLNDQIKEGDIIECIITSTSEGGIFVNRI